MGLHVIILDDTIDVRTKSGSERGDHGMNTAQTLKVVKSKVEVVKDG